jgi:hypothetical protein
MSGWTCEDEQRVNDLGPRLAKIGMPRRLPGICSWFVVTPTKLAPTSGAGADQSLQSRARTTSHSIRWQPMDCPPMVLQVPSPRPMVCSACRSKAMSAVIWCRSSLCLSRPKLPVRSFMIVTVRSLSVCSILASTDPGTTSSRSFRTMFQRTKSLQLEPGAAPGRALFR